jgi:hypothetical protein
MRLRLIHVLTGLALIGAATIGAEPNAVADETIFSGPQVGEKLPPLNVREVLGPRAGDDVDLVSEAEDRAILLIFVHDVNRQSIGMTRVLSGYSASRADDGLHTGVIFLDDDATEAENTIKRISHALAPEAPAAVSPEGREGPGSYGLNRNVMLTILVGKGSKVTANFALIQPSLQVDLPKVLQSIVTVAGGEMPKLESLPGMPQMMRTAGDDRPPTHLRPLLTPLIQPRAKPQQVDDAAAAVEALADKDEAAKREIGQIASRIVAAGKLANYGTPRAQEYLKKWAETYAPRTQSAGEDVKPNEADAEKQRAAGERR